MNLPLLQKEIVRIFVECFITFIFLHFANDLRSIRTDSLLIRFLTQRSNDPYLFVKGYIFATFFGKDNASLTLRSTAIFQWCVNRIE